MNEAMKCDRCGKMVDAVYPHTCTPLALRLADAIDLGWLENVDSDKADIDMIQTELRRLHQHELANEVWHEKTEWVQQTVQPSELGMHRADVLRQRIDYLHAVNEELLEALKAMLTNWEEHPAYGSDAADKARAAIAKATGEQA